MARLSRTSTRRGCSNEFVAPTSGPFTCLLGSAYSSESYGPIMAGAALSALPPLVVFVAANRLEGVRLSGLKG